MESPRQSLLPGLEEEELSAELFPLHEPGRSCPQRVGATPPSPGDAAHNLAPPEGPRRLAEGTGHLSPTCSHNPATQKHKALGFFTVSKKCFKLEGVVVGEILTLRNNTNPQQIDINKHLIVQ